MSGLRVEAEINLDGWYFVHTFRPYKCNLCRLRGLDETVDMEIGVSTGPPG